jgi:hypothetical protein
MAWHPAKFHKNLSIHSIVIKCMSSVMMPLWEMSSGAGHHACAEDYG